jgi:hypothetical protein
MDKYTLLEQLNSFDSGKRKKALISLLDNYSNPAEETENVNMHFHTFFSYNAEGWSPSRIAWEAKQNGLFAAGIIDFDVLDGMDEFLDAGELLPVRTNVGIETRSFLTELTEKEIDSPGEPGVSYIAGTGFGKMPVQGTKQHQTLQNYRETAKQRNISLIERINAKLPSIGIDYDKDVLPLTPSGNATERHIVKAYVNKSAAVFPWKSDFNSFWSDILKINTDETEKLSADRALFENLVRSKLAKKGGIGYQQPTSDTFPKTEDFFSWMRDCRAIPMESWLDGTSDGESDPRALLELSVSKGAEALNIIPDRNWNIKSTEEKAKKYSNLQEIIKTATSMDLPLHIGTEMNKAGLPFVDDLGGKELNPFKELFLRGAKIFTGHTILLRLADFSYVDQQTDILFKTKKEKNIFFESVGKLPPLHYCIADKYRDMKPEKAFDLISESAQAGRWKIT